MAGQELGKGRTMTSDLRQSYKSRIRTLMRLSPVYLPKVVVTSQNTQPDNTISLDNQQNILTTSDLPRANYKIEKIGLIGSSLNTSATFKITILSEIQSAEVPLFSETFQPFGTSDAWSFSPNVTIPQGSVIDVKIVCDKTHTPSLSIGILYGRVR